MRFEVRLPGGIDCWALCAAGLDADGFADLSTAAIQRKATLPARLRCRHVLSDPPLEAAVTVFSFGEVERIDRWTNKSGKIVVKRGRRPESATHVRVEIADDKIGRAIRRKLDHYSMENDGEGVYWREHCALWDEIDKILKRDRLSYEKLHHGQGLLARRAIESLIELCAKTDPMRRSDIHDLFIDHFVPKAERAFAARWLIKEFESDREIDDQLGMRLWDMAVPEIADDLIRLLENRRYGDHRGPLCLALAKTKDARAAGVIASVLGQGLVTRWALEALGQLRRGGADHVEKIRTYQRDTDGDVRREAKKTLKKLGFPVDPAPPAPTHLVKNRRSLPKDLEEWSRNLDMDELTPTLERVSRCVERGFGPAEISEVIGIAEEMKSDQTRAFRFPVVAAGRKSELWLVVFMDDIDAPDLEMHARPEIIRKLDKLSPAPV